MSGAPTPRGEEPGRLSGVRNDFVSSLPRRLEMLRSTLAALELSPADAERRNGLLRRLHALGSSARVLGFSSVAEALGEAEKGLRGAVASGQSLPLSDVARALELLPSLVSGVEPEPRASEARPFPISVLVFGPQGIAEAIGQGDGVNVECERTEDLSRARELCRIIGPDVAVVDADRRGARDLVELFANDPLIEPVPVLVIGNFPTADAGAPFIELGAARVLQKPVSPEILRRAVDQVRELSTRPRPEREPLGELTVAELSERIAEELKRGLIDATESGAQAVPVPFGQGADVLAAVWGAVARVRELVTLRSKGSVRFHPTGPEGAVPVAPWSGEERRAGDRVARHARGAEGVSIQGRKILVADDDPAVVWFMSSLLKAVGAEVVEAHDGRRALEIACEVWPDAVISDVLMPELDGFSLCHEIKRDVAVRDAPVILLSWKEDLLQRLRELGADADGYLRKEAAASAVVERVREVLRPRARVEQRIEAGGEVRGRLDGLTTRLLLELVARYRRDARISVRDAVYLWEVSLRGGRLLGVTRSSADGDFARGPRVLPGLLGVSAGRFVVEPDSTPARAEFEGELHEILREPLARARQALRAVSADALLRIRSIAFDRDGLDPYLSCTPEPALGVIRRLLAAASPRELVIEGHANPRLLEAILSDLARRGAITSVEQDASLSFAPQAPAPAPTAVLRGDDRELDWDEELSEADVASAKPPPPREEATHEPVVPTPVPLRAEGDDGSLPLSAAVTPADWTMGPLFAFGSDERGTLPGMGSARLPAVAARVAPRRQEPVPVALPEEALLSEPPPAPAPQPAAVVPSASPRALPAVVETRAEPAVAGEGPAALEPSPAALEPPVPPPPSPSPSPSLAADETPGADLADLIGFSHSPVPAPVTSEAKPTPELAPLESTKPGEAIASPLPPAPEPVRAELSPEPPAPEPVRPEPPAPVEPSPSPAAGESPSAPVSEPPAAAAAKDGEGVHSVFSEPPVAPSAPLTTEALLAALAPSPAESPAKPEAEVSAAPPEAGTPAPAESESPPSEPRPLVPEEDEEEDEEVASRERALPAPKAARRRAAPVAKAPEAASGGGIGRSIVVAGVSFAAVYAIFNFLVLPLVQKPAPGAAAPPAPSAAPSAVAPAPAPAQNPARIETLPILGGIDVPAGMGLLEIEVAGPDVLYVDGSFVGRGPTRRVPLAPGRHELAVGEGGSSPPVVLDITAGRRTRVSLPAAPR